MKTKLIINEAMLLLEGNHRIAWHFTGLKEFFSILEDGILKFSKAKSGSRDKELSGKYDYFLSTSRTKDTLANNYSMFKSDLGVRFELDISGFKTKPVNFHKPISDKQETSTSRSMGESEYEERIFSLKENKIKLNDSRIVRIDILLDNLKLYNRIFGYETSIESIAYFLKEDAEAMGILNKLFIYDKRSNFLMQNEKTI